jgi:hypothetical protein
VLLRSAYARAGTLVAAGLLSALVVGAESHQQPEGQRVRETLMPQPTIAEVLRDVTDRVMSIPGVMGTAEGRCGGRPCIKIFVAKTTDEMRREIPSVVGGYLIAIEETGEFRAHDR